MYLLPSVIETTGRNSRAYDLPTKLLQNRIVYIGSEITPELANGVIMQLLWLKSDNPEADIELYINSPGGSLYDGLGIKDVIDNLGCKVNTTGTGICASMGAYLLACGTGNRRVTKNCRVMLHSVSSGSRGTYHDMKIDFKETEYLHKQMIKDIAGFTKGKTTQEELESKTERDCYLSPDESVQLGIIDSVV